jgi:hypothetical protein
LYLSQDQDYDKTEVYTHDVLVEVIAKQFFTGNGKADIYTYRTLVQQKFIPGPLVALVCTAVSFFLIYCITSLLNLYQVELSLKDSISGSSRTRQFSDDSNRAR